MNLNIPKTCSTIFMVLALLAVNGSAMGYNCIDSCTKQSSEAWGQNPARYSACKLYQAQRCWDYNLESITCGNVMSGVYPVGAETTAARNAGKPARTISRPDKKILRPIFGDLVDRVTITYGANLLSQLDFIGLFQTAGAQTFGTRIYLEKTREYFTNEQLEHIELLAHELVHSQQWLTRGESLSNFGRDYGTGFCKAGSSYDDNKMEAEARSYETKARALALAEWDKTDKPVNVRLCNNSDYSSLFAATHVSPIGFYLVDPSYAKGWMEIPQGTCRQIHSVESNEAITGIFIETPEGNYLVPEAGKLRCITGGARNGGFKDQFKHRSFGYDCLGFRERSRKFAHASSFWTLIPQNFSDEATMTRTININWSRSAINNQNASGGSNLAALKHHSNLYAKDLEPGLADMYAEKVQEEYETIKSFFRSKGFQSPSTAELELTREKLGSPLYRSKLDEIYNRYQNLHGRSPARKGLVKVIRLYSGDTDQAIIQANNLKIPKTLTFEVKKGQDTSFRLPEFDEDGDRLSYRLATIFYWPETLDEYKLNHPNRPPPCDVYEGYTGNCGRFFVPSEPIVNARYGSVTINDNVVNYIAPSSTQLKEFDWFEYYVDDPITARFGGSQQGRVRIIAGKSSQMDPVRTKEPDLSDNNPDDTNHPLAGTYNRGYEKVSIDNNGYIKLTENNKYTEDTDKNRRQNRDKTCKAGFCDWGPAQKLKERNGRYYASFDFEFLYFNQYQTRRIDIEIESAGNDLRIDFERYRPQGTDGSRKSYETYSKSFSRNGSSASPGGEMDRSNSRIAAGIYRRGSEMVRVDEDGSIWLREKNKYTEISSATALQNEGMACSNGFCEWGQPQPLLKNQGKWSATFEFTYRYLNEQQDRNIDIQVTPMQNALKIGFERYRPNGEFGSRKVYQRYEKTFRK
ncbi:MAG: hypothetical protein CMP10_17520 [Zetaproteobacteria bacterium]|nr:hypothetical protein [Pseudobdellovibrionaceae bacterium]